MKTLKKTLALTLSAAMTLSMSSTVFASDPSTQSGTANILEYSVESVLVPTTLKVALNPGGYVVNTKYKEVASGASFSASNTYYTKNEDGKYEKALGITEFANGKTYYLADESTAQVISLNYGIANKSTTAKDVKIDFKVENYTAAENKKAIEFVDSAEEARAYSATNKIGAKPDETKLYLEVVSAKAGTGEGVQEVDEHYTPQVNITSFGTGDYYESDGATTATTDTAVDYSKTYYKKSVAVDNGVTNALMSDVKMNKAETGARGFVKGTTNKADASIAYSLAKATYVVKNTQIIDFGTKQSDLSGSMVAMNNIGGVAGFTITGVLNDSADWTKADAAKILITPVYTISDTTTYTDNRKITGAENQIGVNLTGALNSDKALKLDITGCIVNETTTLALSKFIVKGVKDEKVVEADITNQLTYPDTSEYKDKGKFTALYSAAGVAYWDAGTSLQYKVVMSDGTQFVGKVSVPTAASGD